MYRLYLAAFVLSLSAVAAELTPNACRRALFLAILSKQETVAQRWQEPVEQQRWLTALVVVSRMGCRSLPTVPF